MQLENKRRLKYDIYLALISTMETVSYDSSKSWLCLCYKKKIPDVFI